ncbi:M15 family peptidase, partial [Kineococcus sp. R8]|uniref:M15 family metallopeptidase n=1 Tax=Kineococcus siccus TaxID=2696567 RepID=UPI001412F170
AARAPSSVTTPPTTTTTATGTAAVAATAGAPVVARQARRPAAQWLPPYTSSISPVTAADLPASWRPGCPVGPADLRAVGVTHVGFDGRPRRGTIVVAASVAQATADAFGRLYELRYPIASVRPVDVFGGSDDASMDADNTSAFNCRATTGGSSFSEHSYGTAIDLNPVENPYVRGTTVLPAAGRAFVDRTPRPGVLVAGDAAVQAFTSRGFAWGGSWRTLKDYQHFSVSGR